MPWMLLRQTMSEVPVFYPGLDLCLAYIMRAVKLSAAFEFLFIFCRFL